MDGFKIVDRKVLKSGILQNMSRYRNTYSPYSRVYESIDLNIDDVLRVDENYGLIYNSWINKGKSFYGETALIPDYGLDNESNFGFLRTPFRKIPRIKVDTRKQLVSHLNMLGEVYDDSTLFFRGQTKEYYLNRGGETLEKLYGNHNELEPSLLNTATREGINIHDNYLAWSGMLKCSIDHYNILNQRDNRKELMDWYSSYEFSLFALSIAQHYGIPSSGLDITSDLNTALFFAQNKFNSLGGFQAEYVEKTDYTDLSVIYVFAMPNQHYFIDHDKTYSDRLMAARPSCQKAFFLNKGWGLKLNESASGLIAAFYYSKDFDIEGLSSQKLFPNQNEDPFGSVLFRFIENSAQLSPELLPLVKSFYWVK